MKKYDELEMSQKDEDISETPKSIDTVENYSNQPIENMFDTESNITILISLQRLNKMICEFFSKQ